MAVGLYIHIPFCRHRCHFCAFYVRIHREDWVRHYLAALQREISLHATMNTLTGRPLETIYFGGGTPTTMCPAQLLEVLAWVRSAFQVVPHPEITVEAHPDTVTAEGLTQLRAAGFTRISFGIQSADRQEVLRLGRRTVDQPARPLLGAARSAGFQSINVDLIYGVPEQTREKWLESVDDIITWAPDHVSCYALSIEEDSHLHLNIKRGDVAPPDLDLQNDFEDAAASRLIEAGFERYEISNYARPGHACRHNLLYWQDEDYLGLGPSAQSYVNGVRFGNLPELGAYGKSLAAGRLPIVESIPLNLNQRRREAIVFGLRLTRGVASSWLQSDDTDTGLFAGIDRLKKHGLLEEQAGRLRLTREGRRFADSVGFTLFG